jgi:hypothetical protein
MASRFGIPLIEDRVDRVDVDARRVRQVTLWDQRCRLWLEARYPAPDISASTGQISGEFLDELKDASHRLGQLLTPIELGILHQVPHGSDF